MRVYRIASTAIAVVLAVAACASDGDDAAAKFTSPPDGATVAGAVPVTMEASGIAIEQAGEARDNAGHFHVIADAGCVDEGETIAKDADHVHFGGGQGAGEIYLEPGTHELCLQVGDGIHRALGLTDRISVTVAVTSQEEWCAVMGLLDQTFTDADQADDFTAVQLEFEKAARLAAQLDEGSEYIDDAARADVRTALAFGANLARAFTTAVSEADARAAAEDLYDDALGGDGETDLPGSGWISETCGIDISD